MNEPWRFRTLALPIAITLGITMLRLVGELQGWSPALFSREPGGLGSLVGIIWLAPVFGVYFALRLRTLGQRPPHGRHALIHLLAAVGLFVAWGVINGLLWPPLHVQFVGAAAASVVVVLLLLRGWPALGKMLLAYAIGARAPVTIVMLFAIYGRWGTHYDAFPEGFPLTEPFQIWLWEGVVVQLTLWVGVTVLFGAILGLVATALAGRNASAAQNAA